MQFRTAGKSVKGLREFQQDGYGSLDLYELMSIGIVTDGNGGEGGDKLAESGVRIPISRISYELSQGRHRKIESEAQLESLGLETVKYTAELITELKSLHLDEWENAGSTITLVLITPELIGTFWIGDSCSYLYSDGQLTKLTSPVHTLAEMLIQQGEPREAIEAQKGLNSILTRALGHDACEPDSRIVKVEGPCFVLTGSDGVFGYLSESEITSILQNRSSKCPDVQVLADEIIQASLDNGSDDNCTIITTFIQPYSRLSGKTRHLTRLCEWT